MLNWFLSEKGDAKMMVEYGLTAARIVVVISMAATVLSQGIRLLFANVAASL